MPCQQNPGSLQLGYYLGDIEGKQKAAGRTAGLKVLMVEELSATVPQNFFAHVTELTK